MSVLPKIRAYEHLGGASGRQIRYRAPRYEARALFDGPFPVAVLDDEPHTLCDLSLSGLAVIGADGERMSEGREISLALKLGDTLLHEGRARIMRREGTDLGTKIGLSVLGRVLDLEEIATRYRHEILRTRLKASLDLHDAEPSAAFRILCADLLDRLRACREVLEAEEAQARADFDGSQSGVALVAACREAIHPLWKEIGVKANVALERVLEDPRALSAMKGFAERVLTAELVTGPLWQRAYRKPLGYAGDFALAAALHAAPTPTETLYASFLDALARDAFAWVPGRTIALAHAMARELAQQKAEAPFRLATIGCGGGEELRALFGRGRMTRPVAVTLVEQDAGALNHAYEGLAGLAIADPARLTLRALHASHAQLQDEGELSGAIEGQHLILAPTLLDYLRHRAATQLLDALYRALAPGGLILAGCLRAHGESSRWASELLCDWSMIHRERDEVIALGVGLPRAKIDVRPASEGDVYILAVRRPRAAR
jgi:hypothetical protein